MERGTAAHLINLETKIVYASQKTTDDLRCVVYSHTHAYAYIYYSGRGEGGGREIPFECYSPVWKNKEGKQNIFSFHQNRKERGNGVGSRSIDIMDGCQSKEIVPFYPKLGGWGEEIYGSVSREGCIPSSPPGVGTCTRTGKRCEISPPSFAFSL